MLTLYFAPGASSMAAHIALYEVGAPFDGRPLSLARRETRMPEYLALNPEGKVPTLLVDGRPLTDSKDTPPQGARHADLQSAARAANQPRNRLLTV